MSRRRARSAVLARLAMLAMLAPLAVLTALASPVAAAPELEAGFRSIVEPLGPRALWVNPAALGDARRPTILTEVGWRRTRDASGDDSWGAKPDVGGVAAGMGRAGWGAQWEGEDLRGAADWTLAAARCRRSPGGLAFGSTVEWRGGEDNALDATLGFLMPVGRSLRAAAVVRDVFESDRDGAPTERAWQTGLAWGFRSVESRLIWDAVWDGGGRDDAIHRFGVAFTPPTGIRLRWLGDFDDEWNGSVGWDAGDVLVEFGVRRADSTPDGAWISVVWRGRSIPR